MNKYKILDDIDFEKLGGLVPVITQDYQSNKVLMLGFINKEALIKTFETNKATYWSRSRNKLWTKGESSGNYQSIKEILIDCDNDTLIYKVEQQGLKASCHMGYESCFYRKIEDFEIKDTGEKRVFNPEKVYGKGE